jgi:hypothetical protein
MCEGHDKTQASAFTYERAVVKGWKLLKMMQADDAAAGLMFDHPRCTASSDMTSTRDAVESGYAFRSRFEFDETLEPYADLLATLGSHESGDNLELLWWHEFESQPDGKQCPPTGAMFDNVVNDKAGMIMALDNVTPSHKLAKKFADREVCPLQRPLPKLRHWSDAAYLQWQSCAATSDLRYALRANIHNADTLAVMGHILRVNANNAIIYSPSQCPGRIPRMRPRWPGVVFDMTEEKAQVLLGTPNGSGVGWLLVQRKQELGHKVVVKVSMFFSELFHEDGDIEEQPNLLFYIQDVEK